MQALLTIADKYDMPPLRARAGTFLQANAQHLSSCPTLFGSPQPLFAWKWIALADRAGLAEVAQACFDSCFSRADGHALLEECSEELLQGMSHGMLRHMFCSAEIEVAEPTARCSSACLLQPLPQEDADHIS
jgi:hypothetical protein